MNDLDALRAALPSSRARRARRSVDVDRIMALGSRIRRRRRLATGGAALAVTAALLVGVAVMTHLRPSTEDAAPELVISGGQAPDPDRPPPRRGHRHRFP